ncbi:MAG: hypothetical protein M4579_004535 [Chaenotheca gracillima]|nr:MAG: hypothetical protein M4579_004535 [Chaenotheca gracillima]
MGKRKLGALEKVDLDLAGLQYKVRGDPVSYKDEFSKQYIIYEASRDLFIESPAASTVEGVNLFKDLVEFIAHVADCYPDLTRTFPQDLIDILTTHHAKLESELREKIVGSLVLLRKKAIIDSSTLLQTLFPILTTTPSKSLRAVLFQKILSDLRSSNSKTTNHRLNRTIQTVLFNLLTSDRSSGKGIWAVKLTRELWKRQIWSDSKAVEIMKEASLAENEKVIVGGVRFFLGGDKEREEQEEDSSDDDDEAVDLGAMKHQAGINKKSKKKAKAIDKAAAMVKKKERKKNQAHPLNFSALHLLHDPQGFAETLFSKHLQNGRSRLNLEQKLLVLQLVTRLVGLHKLTILSLYSYFIKYLTPRQPSVTSFLVSLAQSTHNLIPPDVLEPLIQKIANEFVSEAAAAEVAASGLNAIREVCTRQPLAMTDTLLQDLVMYRKSKDKGVVMAAKGLLSLYREVGADMLRKRDRGKAATMGIRAGKITERRFGDVGAGAEGGIEGLELLEEWMEEEKKRKRRERGLASDDEAEDEALAEEADWAAWEAGEDNDDESDDSGGWINVESDAEIQISDSDDDEHDKAVQAKKLKPNPSSESPAPINAATTLLSSLATQRILTPADLAKLKDLRLQQATNATLSRSKPTRKAAPAPNAPDPSEDPNERPLSPTALTLTRRTPKNARDRVNEDEKETHQGRSKQARRHERKTEQGKSTTNSEKARKKNMLMTLGKARGKKKRSLVEQRRVLKAHVDRAKRGGKRGNKGS